MMVGHVGPIEDGGREKRRAKERNLLENLREAWETNNHLNLLLLDRISDDGLDSTLSKRGGRNVAGQFAHLHNVRAWHLEKRARDLAGDLVTFATGNSPDTDELRDALALSCTAVGSFLEGVLAGVPKRRGFKKGIFTTIAYFVAHESYHRGNILLTLKQCGHPVDQRTRYAIWDWDRM